jgi:hypothetical protein
MYRYKLFLKKTSIILSLYCCLVFSCHAEDKTLNMDQFADELKQKGWSIEHKNDGSIILMPKPAQKPVTKEEPNEVIPLLDMKSRLETYGWKANIDKDGNLNLIPPDKIKKKTTQHCQGTLTNANINLPVDSWIEAHHISEKWLEIQAIPNSTVGKIRKILNVYIVSIVGKETPYSLLHQIAINNHTGKVLQLN